jgi:hypothetical protein
MTDVYFLLCVPAHIELRVLQRKSETICGIASKFPDICQWFCCHSVATNPNKPATVAREEMILWEISLEFKRIVTASAEQKLFRFKWRSWESSTMDQRIQSALDVANRFFFRAEVVVVPIEPHSCTKPYFRWSFHYPFFLKLCSSLRLCFLGALSRFLFWESISS